MGLVDYATDGAGKFSFDYCLFLYNDLHLTNPWQSVMYLAFQTAIACEKVLTVSGEIYHLLVPEIHFYWKNFIITGEEHERT